MDRAVVDQKLESLRRCILRIESKATPTAEGLASDFDLQDIISLNLSRAVQLTVDIGAHLISELNLPAPDTMGQTFDLLERAGLIDAALAMRMRKAVGFRNIATHNYDQINWDIVHNIVKYHLDDFAAFARVITQQIQRQAGQ